MTATILRKSRLLGQVFGLGALSLLLGGCPGGGAVGANYNANEKLAFPVTNSAVAIDGIAGAAEWNKSFKFYLEDGASTAAAFMRGMSDAENLYLYFETEDTGGFDANDAVVLAFNPTNASNDYKRLLIYPCQDHPCISSNSGADPHVSYGSGSESGGVVTWGAITEGLPPGVTVKANAGPNGMNGRWTVEIKIAKANYPFLANNFFGMFADVIATDQNLGEGYQYTWPAGGYIGDDLFSPLVDAKLPLPRWGNVTLDTSLFPAGLQITGFGNVGTDPSKISLTGNNEFFATVANSPAGTGAEPDSTGVTATFKINNIGLSPNWAWTDIPSTSNPTSPPETVKSREYMALSSGDWPLLTTGNYQGSGMSQHDFFAANPHQCVRVDVAHSGGGSPITRQYNMNFVTVNSPFDVAPQISTGAWRKFFPRAQSVTLQEQFLNGGRGFEWESRFEGAEPAGPHRWVINSLKDETRMLRTSILAGPSLKLPSQQFKLDPAAMSAGKTVDIPVRGGSVVTLLTDGEATIGKARYGAAGMTEEAAKRAEIKAEAVRDSLRPGLTARVGALLGSFDDFRTSFQIGTGSTIFVPFNAQQLRLRFAKGVPFSGGGFDLQVVMTEANPVALDGASLADMRAAKGPVLLPLGMNLPMHIVRGTLNTGMGVSIGGKKFTVGVPMGSYGSLVRSVRGSGPDRPDGPQIRRPLDTLTVRPAPAATAVAPR